MIYKHKKSGDLYCFLMVSFDVQTQQPHNIYVKLETGEVFNRDVAIFDEKFTFVSDVQGDIHPNPLAASEEEIQDFVSRTQAVIMSDKTQSTRSLMLSILGENKWRSVRDIPRDQFEDVLMRLTLHVPGKTYLAKKVSDIEPKMYKQCTDSNHSVFSNNVCLTCNPSGEERTAVVTEAGDKRVDRMEEDDG